MIKDRSSKPLFPITREKTTKAKKTRIHHALAATVLLLTTTTAAPSAHGYVSPTTKTEYPGKVLRAFDNPEHNWLSGHRGVDLEATPSQTIYAAGDGIVAFAGSVAGTPVISIDHEPGKRTTYQPVHAYVKQGDSVTEGQAIGFLGQSTDGFSGLHWGLLTGKDQYANPLHLLNRPVIRLKPVDGRS